MTTQTTPQATTKTPEQWLKVWSQQETHSDEWMLQFIRDVRRDAVVDIMITYNQMLGLKNG